jgi:hypothetical protein
MSDTRSRFSEILHAAHTLQQQLSDEGYDQEDIIGALESETDVMRMLDRTIEKVVADERLAASATERAKRLKERAAKRRKLLDVIMVNLERDKLERPLATVYYVTNPVTLVIDNPDDIPMQYYESMPDKAMITKALHAGADIPGVHLSTPKRGLRLKVT